MTVQFPELVVLSYVRLIKGSVKWPAKDRRALTSLGYSVKYVKVSGCADLMGLICRLDTTRTKEPCYRVLLGCESGRSTKRVTLTDHW